MIDRAAAYQDFKDRLTSGELLPGQFVTQKELASFTGVSIAVAREAIQKLESEHLLKIHPQRGIQITDITTKFIHNAYGLRLLFEQQAVQEVARSGSDSMIEALIAQTDDILARIPKEAADPLLALAVDVDWQMHDAIMGHLGNELIWETYQANATRIRLIRVSNRLSPGRVVTAFEEHRRILTCCKSRDPEAASAAMKDHIETAMNRALQRN